MTIINLIILLSILFFVFNIFKKIIRIENEKQIMDNLRKIKIYEELMPNLYLKSNLYEKDLIEKYFKNIKVCTLRDDNLNIYSIDELHEHIVFLINEKIDDNKKIKDEIILIYNLINDIYPKIKYTSHEINFSIVSFYQELLQRIEKENCKKEDLEDYMENKKFFINTLIVHYKDKKSLENKLDDFINKDTLINIEDLTYDKYEEMIKI